MVVAMTEIPASVYRSLSYAFAIASFIMVAVMEPDCGYAGHPVCYKNCGFYAGSHFTLSLIGLMPFYMALVPLQCCTAFPVAFPSIRSSAEPNPDELEAQGPEIRLVREESGGWSKLVHSYPEPAGSGCEDVLT